MKGAKTPLPSHSKSIIKGTLCLVENRCVVTSWDASSPFFHETLLTWKKKVFWSVNLGKSHSMHIDYEEPKQRGLHLYISPSKISSLVLSAEIEGLRRNREKRM